MRTEIIEINSYSNTVLKLELYLQDSDVLTIVLPGMFYTVWGPVLYYAANTSFELGFDTLLIEYGYQKANTVFHEKNYDDILNETLEAIEIACSKRSYKKLVFIGKSFGTELISRYLERFINDYKVIPVLITPTKKALLTVQRIESLVIIGDNDPYVTHDDVETLRKLETIHLHIVKGAGHDLDAETVEASIEALKTVQVALKAYLT